MTGPAGHSDPAVRAALEASFLAGLPAGALERVLAEATRLEIRAGTTFYGDAEHGQGVLVVGGLMRLYLASAEGRQVTVRYARPGDVVGTAALVGGPSPANAQALTDVSLLTFRLRTLQDLGRSDARVAWAIAEEVTRRLYDTLEVVAGTTFGTVRQRVARHLLDLAAAAVSRQAGQASQALVAPVSQQELADAVGSVREVIARALRQLREEGLVETVPHGIALLDPAALHAAAWSRSPQPRAGR